MRRPLEMMAVFFFGDWFLTCVDAPAWAACIGGWVLVVLAVAAMTLNAAEASK